MNYPGFYRPNRVGELYVPDPTDAIAAGRDSGVSPSSEAQLKTILVLVDMQVDFVHEAGALSVPGAVEDTRRVIEWIFRNLGDVTTIAASLDSHVPMSIFFPTWWVDENENPPEPYTVIRSADVKAGKWKPLYEYEWSMKYCARLEASSRKELMIWPYHTLIGTQGHAIMPALYETIAYHSAARQTQPIFLQKGTIPQSEYYSMLEPEIKVPNHPMGDINVPFLNILSSYDRIYIAGEAKSHCVLETIGSIMRYFGDKPEVINRLRVLEDCMSSVAHPVIDFDAWANLALEVFVEEGLHMVKSTDALR